MNSDQGEARDVAANRGALAMSRYSTTASTCYGAQSMCLQRFITVRPSGTVHRWRTASTPRHCYVVTIGRVAPSVSKNPSAVSPSPGRSRIGKEFYCKLRFAAHYVAVTGYSWRAYRQEFRVVPYVCEGQSGNPLGERTGSVGFCVVRLQES